MVGVPNLTGAVVGEAIPADLVEFATRARQAPKVEGKPKLENAIVEAITSRPEEFGLEGYFAELPGANKESHMASPFRPES